MIVDYITSQERLNFKRRKTWKCNVFVKSVNVKITQTICTIMNGLRQKIIVVKDVLRIAILSR